MYPNVRGIGSTIGNPCTFSVTVTLTELCLDMVSDPESGANLNIGCPNLIDLFMTMTTADMNKDEPQTTNEVHVIENEEKRRVN